LVGIGIGIGWNWLELELELVGIDRNWYGIGLKLAEIGWN
jgi:hypothetical protein